MKNQNFAKFAMGLLSLGLSLPALAWNGPVCYQDAEQQIVLTIRTYAGEMPGELEVKFDDSEGELELVAVRPSTTYANAHEVVLHHPAGRDGIIGVELSAPNDTYGAGTYEFEFRADMSWCSGAVIKSDLK